MDHFQPVAGSEHGRAVAGPRGTMSPLRSTATVRGSRPRPATQVEHRRSRRHLVGLAVEDDIQEGRGGLSMAGI